MQFLLQLLVLCAVCCSALKLSMRADKTNVIITGANRGIGFAAAKQLSANKDYQIVLACRDVSLATAAMAQMNSNNNVEVMELDLADLDSVRSFGKAWGGRRVDVLCCNAGIQVGKGVGVGKTTPADADSVRRTKQGYELTVGTNHIGHFALVQDFLPKIAKTAAGGVGKARVVYTGSGVHNPDEPGGDVGSKATLGDMEGLAKGYKPPISMVDGKEKFDSDKAYKDSKLCNVCTSLETARRLKASSDPALNRITVNVMNPGLIPTSGLFRDLNPFFVAIFTLITRYIARVAVSEEEGGRRLAFMVESPMLDNVTGGYFSGKPGFYEFSAAEASKEATNEAVGKKLWDLTEKIVKGK